VNGQVVKHLVNEKLLPGDYSVVWDATNANGNKVESGFYFYKISSGGKSQTEKMILLH
jgi:flagellar hook assembly protein FlgD